MNFINPINVSASEYLKGRCQEDGTRLLSVVSSNRTRGKKHKLEHRKIDLNINKNVTLRVSEHWKKLPGETVESSSVEIFKTCLDVFPGNLL